MASASSLLNRLSPSRNGRSPTLALHSRPRVSPAEADEYTLSELSAQAEDGLLSGIWPEGRETTGDLPQHQQNSPPVAAQRRSAASRVLFREPPPPIAASSIFPSTGSPPEQGRWTSGGGGTRTSRILGPARQMLKSVVFDHASSVGSHDRTYTAIEPDAVWRSLQRRERALQEEVQRLLDSQAAALVLQLDPKATPSASSGSANATPHPRSVASDAGSDMTPTGNETFYSTRSTQRLSQAEESVSQTQTHSTLLQPTRSSAAGDVIPVRQPRKRRLGLRGARAGLGRALQQLADLKAEEEASLASALSARKTALAQLKRLARRRDSVAEELHGLEEDVNEPLGLELRALQAEQTDVGNQIQEVEKKLVTLRQRKRWVDAQIGEMSNRREAGLSGYRGALQDVEARIDSLLRRPPVQPLDLQAIRPNRPANAGTDEDESGVGEPEARPIALDFLRLRPDRRTLEMAKDWWEEEVDILESRRSTVGVEQRALEAGEEIWRGTTKLVSDFERELRQELQGPGQSEDDDKGTGKTAMPDPEVSLRSQITKVGTVITDLEQRLSTAKAQGWNLLICAIGAELEAFQQGERMLRDALRMTTHSSDSVVDGSDPSDKTDTCSKEVSTQPAVVDADSAQDTESDGEIPRDLLVSKTDEHDDAASQEGSTAASVRCRPDREDSSENEIPTEFLAEHG